MRDLPDFTDHPSAIKNPDRYIRAEVDVVKALKSYQLSLLSYEVMHKDGSLRALEDLPEKQREKHAAVLDMIAAQESLITPVAGLGINDNFEIGAARDVFVTLASLGHTRIPVHIHASQMKELEQFVIKD